MHGDLTSAGRWTPALGTRAAFAVVIFLAALLPVLPLARVVTHPLLALSKEVLVLGVCVFCPLAAIGGRIDGLKIPSAGIAVTGLFIIYALSHVLLTDRQLLAAVDSARYMLMYPTLVVVLFFVATKRTSGGLAFARRSMHLTMLATFCAALVVSGIGFYERFFNPDFVNLYGERNIKTAYLGMESIRIVATLENPITLGVFMQVALVCCYYLFATAKGVFSKSLLFLCGAAFCLTTFFTLSRGSMVAMALILLYMFFRTLALGSLRYKTFALVIVAVMIVALSTIWVISANDGKVDYLDVVRLRLLDLVSAVQDANDGRVDTWTEEVLPFLDKTWPEIAFGSGLGYIGWRPGSFVMENGYLALLFELGAVGLALFGTVLLRFGYNTVRLARSPDMFSRGFGKAAQLYFLAYAFILLIADVHMAIPLVYYFWVFYLFSEMLLALGAAEQSAPRPVGGVA